MSAKTLYAIHTGPVLVEVIKPLVKELLPGTSLVNIMDDGLLSEVREAGHLTTAVTRRLIGYGVLAASAGASAILNCCSSVGEAAEMLARVVDIPVVRIDEAMAERAVESGSRIGVIATLATTLDPTKQLILRKAKLSGRNIEVKSYVADSAFDSLLSGDPQKHDALVNAVIDRAIDENEVVVLAQGSMARLVAVRQDASNGRILTSPRTGVESLRKHLQMEHA
ncbi:MAG TPA: aspartate/glutamate racemase family protein [Terriglobales bacterium]|nr:aspartate/glutamate racemase family protein [Terriglobales bacterium]